VDSGALWTDDVVDVFLDPGRTADYRYIHIEFNSRGKMTRRYMKNDLSWDPKGLVLKTAVGDDRWTAELKIPFEDMGIEKGKRPILWGANFGRSRWARRPAMDETPGWMNWDTMWQPNPIGSPHTPEWFGNLIFEKADLVQEKLATFLSSKGMDLAAAGLKVWKPEPPKPRSADVEDGYGPPVEPAFAKGPVAVRQGDRIRITFAVKEYCDAAVWIEDEAGRMVRHLDAGALGPNAPPQFVPDSLEQTLVWDGKDDDGNQVDVSKCRVKVGLGLRGKFDRIIGWKPGIGGIRGIVAGNDGALCVMTGEVSVDHGWGGCWIRAFDSGGRYLRQIYPFPPNLPLSKLAGARPIPLPDGSWLPVIYQGLNHSLLPQTPGIPDQQPAMTRDGHIIMSNMTFRGMGHGRRLLKIGADGSIPADFLGPQISRYQLDGDFYIALSPDDKYVYVTGLKGRYMWDGGDFHHAVYRVKWDDPDLTELFRKPFIGDPTKAGRDERSLNRPLGLAVDAEGNIFVADSGNGRIAVFRPDGSPLRQISLPDPRNVAVNSKTGAIYAVGKPDGGKGYALVKFKSPADTSPAARVGLQGGSSNFALAVVPDADPPIVWVANGDKVLDKGDSLEIAGNLHKMHSGPYSDVSCGFEGHLMTVNPKTEEIIVGKWHVFDGKTGKFLRHIRLENADGWGGEIAIGKDGNFYVRSGGGSNALWKYSPDGKRLPFKEGVMEVPKLYGGHGNSNRGHCVGPDGDIYFVHHYIPHGNTETTLSRIAPDGTIKKLEFVENHLVSGSGVQVDRRGCIYMGLAVKPFGEPYPKWFEGRLPSSGAAPEPWFFYRQMYGSIVKFKPEGGRLVSDPEGPYMATNYSHFHRCRIEGAVWVRYGYSQMHQKDIESSRCNCQSARFGMDGFDRLYIPDSMRASVDIADSNGNRIIRLGRYGNMDSRGPGSPVPKPELPMSWPLVVCATDTACYVADQVNGWVLKIALHYAVEKECAIR
ncbi:MAG: SMP-30/gluconolactonase/LRE family protein, partial [Planctomycetota bacterium]|nr:SMP-30/gluconolactonase/LRE family protein [Planctomycetota bacterium]